MIFTLIIRIFLWNLIRIELADIVLEFTYLFQMMKLNNSCLTKTFPNSMFQLLSRRREVSMGYTQLAVRVEHLDDIDVDDTTELMT